MMIRARGYKDKPTTKKKRMKNIRFHSEIQFCIIEFYLSIFDICSLPPPLPLSYNERNGMEWLNDGNYSFVGRDIQRATDKGNAPKRICRSCWWRDFLSKSKK